MGIDLASRVRPARARRRMAVAALLLGVVGTVVVVFGVLASPLQVLWFGLCCSLGLVALFAVLTTQGHRRALAVAGALVVAVGLVAGVIVSWGDEDRNGVALLGGLAMVTVSGVLGRASLRVPPHVDPDAFHVATSHRPVERPVLIVNLRSGGGKAEQCGLLERAAELDIPTRVLGPGDDLRALAEAAVADGADCLGMAGGDGSLGLVASVAMAHDLPFVCVPAGTRNHFALDVGLDRDDPCSALAAFTAGDEHRIDVATANDRVFVNNVALGLYAAVVAQPEYRDAKLGTALAQLPTLVTKDDDAYELSFDVPDHGRWDEAALVMISNNPYELRPPRAFGRRRRLDTGQLGIVAVDVAGAASMAAITALAAFQSPELSPHVWPWAAASFTVASPHAEVPAGIDGEAVPLTTPIQFRTHPGALRLLVPPGAAVGLDAQDPSVAVGPLSGLLEVIRAPVDE